MLGSFILGWWALAFQSTIPSEKITSANSQTLSLNNTPLLQALSPLKRNDLQSALTGNFCIMQKLIDTWNNDAKRLYELGIENIQFLSAEKLTQARILKHLIANSSPSTLHKLNCKMKIEMLQDDCGNQFHIKDDFQKFLPQTFVAASFLLSIAQTNEILALPKGLRQFTQLFPKEILNKIPTDIDQINSEILYLNKPDLAFISPYSHPPTLEALNSQCIPLYTIKNINSAQEIGEALLKVGHATNHILQAQLLAIFIEASLLSIDNRLEALKSEDDPLKILYLTYYHHYALPTTKSLAGQLMCRALQHCKQFKGMVPENSHQWQIPFSHEQIMHANPDVLIVAICSKRALPQIKETLQHTKPLQSNQVYCLDEAIQNSPTQHIVLAYFDLFETLIHSNARVNL